MPSRAVALLTFGMGSLWQPNPSPEDRRAKANQSAAALGRDDAGAAGYALDSALF